MTTTPNVITTAVVLIGATLVPVVAILLWHPELFLYIVVIFAVCAIVGLLIVAAEARADAVEAHQDAVEWCTKAEQFERQLEARAPGVTMVPHVTFPTLGVNEGQRATPAERPDLHIVGPQRDGGHDRLPVADGSFPVHTAVDEDELTALVRATEEKA